MSGTVEEGPRHIPYYTSPMPGYFNRATYPSIQLIPERGSIFKTIEEIDLTCFSNADEQPRTLRSSNGQTAPSVFAAGTHPGFS